MRLNMDPITLTLFIGSLAASGAAAEANAQTPLMPDDIVPAANVELPTGYTFKDEAAKDSFLRANPDAAKRVVQFAPDPADQAGNGVIKEGSLPDIDAVLAAEGISPNRDAAAPFVATTREGRMRELADAIRSGTLGSATPVAGGSATPVAGGSATPVAKKPVYSEGFTTDLHRFSRLHSFQRAWEKSKPSEGVFESPYCPTCVYKMQVRELMMSNFILPEGEQIVAFDIGDDAVFQASIRSANILAISAKTFGADTNINVYTQSGRVYPIYVRSLDVQSHLLPDLVFRVTDPNITHVKVDPVRTIASVAEVIDAPPKIDTTQLLENLKPQNISDEDFLSEIPFDPGRLRFDGFRVYGSEDRKLAPSRVFRDDKHIYIQFDPHKAKLLPGFTAYSVFDGIDERIGTRISGNTFIIKALVEKVTLKSGNSYLCIDLDKDVV